MGGRGTRTVRTSIVGALVVLISLTGCAGGGSGGSPDASASAPAGSSASTTPQGVVDDAFEVGSGVTVVELFTDASCPHCASLDEAIGDEIQQRIDAGEITYRHHPVNYVSAKRADDSDFSTRVANLLAVAADHGDVDLVPAIYSAAIAEQAPTLDDPMPDDDELIALAEGAGLTVDDTVREDIVGQRWRDWVQAVNDRAVGAPVGDTGVNLTGVPTLVVGDVVFEILEDGTDLLRLQKLLDEVIGSAGE